MADTQIYLRAPRRLSLCQSLRRVGMRQVRDLRERNLRVLADMENLRERSAKAAQSTKQYAIQARHCGGISYEEFSIACGA